MFSIMRKSFDMSDERLSVPPPPASEKMNKEQAPRRVKIGLALGAGAARGWAHIGVLRVFAEHGIVPDVIAGTSIGAVVGGCYAAGRLDQIEAFARSLTKRRVFALMDLSFSGMSLISGERLKAALEHEVKGVQIEELPIPFAAVATEVGTGHEIWLQRGALDLAIRASYALPGILEPVRIGERFLFDGALVNPVPVTVCRALGAEYVIAINMASDMMYRSKVVADQLAAASTGTPVEETSGGRASAAPESVLLPRYFRRSAGGAAPNVATAMVDAFNIVQDRILRSRLAGDPPDAIVNARGDDIGMFDFHRAEQSIAMGRDAAKRALPTIFSHIPAAALSS